MGTPEVSKLTDVSPSLLGVVALFGDGIRDLKHGDHGFTPARFSFAVPARLLDRMKSGSRLQLTFVPRGILIEGKSGPLAKSSLTIGKVSVALQTRTPGPEKNGAAN